MQLSHPRRVSALASPYGALAVTLALACTPGNAPTKADPGTTAAAAAQGGSASEEVVAPATAPEASGDADKDKPEPEPEPKRVDMPAAPSCVAPIGGIPKGLPDDAKECLSPAYAFALGPRFFEPPTPKAKPCALETFDEKGELLRVGKVERFDAREHRVRYEETDPDDPNSRTITVQTDRFDKKGRLVEELWEDQQFVFDPKVPDCENFSTTKLRYDRQGWPARSDEVIETCEGVDAGRITIKRSFSWPKGFARAQLDITDRGDEGLTGTEYYIPDPRRKVAKASCDQWDDCSCELKVRDCEGIELGWVVGGGKRPIYYRWRWSCDEAGAPVVVVPEAE